jgi:hypothetical protein
MVKMCSYSGDIKQLKGGSKLLEITGFSFENKYYKPAEPISFFVVDESDGWVTLSTKSLFVHMGGAGLEEVIRNALMATSDQVHDILFEDDDNLSGSALNLKQIFASWEVYIP